MKNIIIYSHMGNFSFVDGGTVVQYNLAKIITDLGHNVRIYSTNKIPNPVFSKFYDNDFPIDDNAVVIYCEGTQGNPLNAKNVVRWLLSEMGKNVPYDWVNGWGKNELVYFFNYDKLFSNNEEMVKGGRPHRIVGAKGDASGIAGQRLKRLRLQQVSGLVSKPQGRLR
jgi:hypothetical protein